MITLLATTALVSVAAQALAADTTWTFGAGTQNWAAAGNWNTNNTPTAADNVFINQITDFPFILAGTTAAGNIVTVGRTANGNMGISGTNSALNATSVWVGNLQTGDDGGVSQLVVNGGGDLTMTNDFILGVNSAGSAVIQTAGLTVGGDAYVGFGDGVSAALTIDALSQANVTGNLVVGNGLNGTGTLSILSGADVDVGSSLVAGKYQDTIGTVTVNGTGTTLDVTADITVGDGGTATMSIQAGAAVTAGAVDVASGSPSTGALTVTGLGSTLSSNGLLYVGDQGNGTLNVLDGAHVGVTQSTFIGNDVGSVGTVLVSGVGSALTAANSVYVAYFGMGTLTINQQASVSATDINLGEGNGNSNGTANVEGINSVLVLTDATNVGAIGSFGIGTLNITNGGTVSAATGSLSLGEFGTGNGTVNVSGTGSSLILGGELSVGVLGTGTLMVTAGASANVGGNVYIGQTLGANGSATVTGVGSTLAVGGALHVGDASTGNLVIADGGTVTSEGSILVGALSNSAIAEVQITGAGSKLTGKTGISIGSGGGTGTVTISNGGAVNLKTPGSGSTNIGLQVNSTGTLIVTGAGSSYANNSMVVGSAGSGQLIILDGAAVATTSVILGSAATGAGTALLSGAGTTWNTSSNPFRVGLNGVGRLTIADGATLNLVGGTGTLTVAENAGSVGIVNIGALTGDAAFAAGALNAATVVFGAGVGALNFNHTDANYAFAAGISGMGSINQHAGVTNLTGDSSGFAGATNVIGGSLYVNGTLGGLVDVTGGTLGGSGTLTGALTVNSGGTLAPGNSIGTLNVSSLTINAGSTYGVELNNGGFVAGTNNDLINATGMATINGGTVHVTPVNGADNGITYTSGTYTILTAAGGVTGTYTTLTDDYAFLDFVLGYDANSVFLNSTLTATTFCLAGMTKNQCATGDGAFSLASGNLFTAIANLSAAEAPGALDQLSGEVHASTKTALLDDSRFAREAAFGRLRTALGGAGASAEAESQSAVWGQGFGAWGDWAGDGNAASMGRGIGGVFIGGDALVTDDVRLGLMGGYSRSSFSVDDRMTSGNIDTYTLGLYGGGEWDAFTLNGGAAHSWHSLNTSRSLALSGFSDSLAAGYVARTVQAYGEAAYGIEVGSARFEPFANLAYVNLSTDGFTETGGAAALTSAGDVVSATFTTLGLRAETTLALGEMDATLRGMAGWRHVFGDTPSTTHGFASGGGPFTVAGVPMAKDALVLDAGLDLDISEAATLGLSYNGEFGSGLSGHGVKANLAVKF